MYNLKFQTSTRADARYKKIWYVRANVRVGRKVARAHANARVGGKGSARARKVCARAARTASRARNRGPTFLYL